VRRPRACLAVLNYDGRELLDEALPSIVAQDYEPFEVVVVDNGSRDGSPAYVRERWPSVRVVALERNVGVTAALNACVAAAGDADVVALLNNDVELAPDWLATLVRVLEEHPDAAAAAGKLLRQTDRRVIDRAGDMMRWSSWCGGRGSGEIDDGQYDAAGEIFSVGGAAALYRRAALEDVGPFDEDYFAYLEDVDWGFRARLAGYTARYEPAALGYHRGGATLGQINAFSLFHLRRNQVWFVVKNYPGRELLRHAPAVIAFNLVEIAVAVKRRQLRIVLRAYAAALAGLPAAMRKRRAIQRARRIGPDGLRAMVLPARGAP
jgi:GT2 family glycosyltransferase